MRVVHKVVIDLRSTPVTVLLPLDARIVHVQAQHPDVDPFVVSVWFDGDDMDTKSKRCFQAFGTGHPVFDDMTYLSTHVLLDGVLVLHLFEMT